MPRVPSYEQQVPVSEAGPTIRLSEDQLTTGSRQQLQFNQQLGQSADALGQITERLQQVKDADSLFRAESGIKEDYRAFEVTAKQRTGVNAWNVMQDTSKWWDENSKKYGDTLQTPRQQRLFAAQLGQLRGQSLDVMAGHEAAQRRASLEDSATASIVSSINLAAGNAGDPAVVSASKDDVLKRVQVVADLNGWSPAMREAKEAAYLTDFHKQVIQSLVDEQPDQARAYYEANKGEIAGAAQAEIHKVIETGTTLHVAQTTADQLAGKSEQDGIKWIRENLDGEQQKAASEEWRGRFAQDRAARDNQQKDFGDSAWKTFDQTGSLAGISAATWAGMDGRAAEELKKYALAKARGETVKTDFGVWSDVRDKVISGQRVDLKQYVNDIGEADLKQLRELQANPYKLYEAKIDQDDFNSVAESAGLRPFDPKKSEAERSSLGELKQRVETMIDQRQTDAKRPMTREEKRALMQQELDNHVLVHRTILSDEPRAAITLAPDEVGRAYVNVGEQKVYLKDIPAEDRAAIIAARQKNGLPVSEQVIAEYYLRGQQQRR